MRQVDKSIKGLFRWLGNDPTDKATSLHRTMVPTGKWNWNLVLECAQGNMNQTNKSKAYASSRESFKEVESIKGSSLQQFSRV